MESIIESHSRESLDQSLYKSLKIDNCSIVSRFDSLGKKTMQLNGETRRKKLLETLLRKKIKKTLTQTLIRWNVRTHPELIKSTIHSLLHNAPVSKVTVFYRLFHDTKRSRKNKDRTLYSLIKQNGEKSVEVADNVMGYLNRRRKSALVEMAKLHDSLSLLDKKKQKQIMDSITFKISEAEFTAKHHALTSFFQNTNNVVKKQFKFFKDMRISKLLYSILMNKRRGYLKIWFVKTNEVLLPSNISSIRTGESHVPSVFWTSLLHKPSPQISFLAEQSKVKENVNFTKPKSAYSNQNASVTPRKLFFDEQPKRNMAGLMIANSFSYLSDKKSQVSSFKKKDLTVQVKHLHYILCSLIKMRLFNGLSSIKHQYQKTPLSSKQSIQQLQQLNRMALKVLVNLIQKKVIEIQRDVFEVLLVVGDNK